MQEAGLFWQMNIRNWYYNPRALQCFQRNVARFSLAVLVVCIAR